MKKTSLLLILTFLTLSSCSSKWTEDVSGIPDEILALDQQYLDEAMLVLEEDPENIEALFEVAYRYDMLGDLKNAEKYYLKVIELVPNHQVAHNNLMNVYEDVEEYQKAAEEAQILFNLDPRSVEVLKDVVRIFLKAGEADDAQLALEYFSTENANDMTEEKQLLISELYEEVINQQSTNEAQ